MRLKDKAIIVTGGTSGIGAAIAAASIREGAKVLVHVINEEEGRATVEKLGANAVLCIADLLQDSAPKEIVSAALKAFGKIDGVVDAAGVSATLKVALDVIRPNGWISKVGWGPQPVNFSLDQLVQKNVRLEGSFSHNWPMWERALRMLGTGQLDLTPVLGGTFPIEQWETAFKKMHSGEFIKSVIKPA